METRDILYIALTIGVLVLAGTTAYAAFRLAQVFKALKILVEDVSETAKEVNLLKEKLKSSSISLIALLLKGLLKKNLSKRVVK